MPRLSALSRSIAGKVALVTGAASGMGRATAHLFADEGASVAVVDSNADGVKTVVEEVHGGGGVAEGWALDVADRERVTDAVGAIGERFGALDILVNNAGTNVAAPIEHEAYEDAWERVLQVNLAAHARLVRACLPQLLRSDSARIVNIASTEGLGATPFISPYTASKHGVIGLTRALAVELGPRGVTVNCVCPGPIRTGMTASIPEEHKTRFARRRVPLHRYGDPEEVAHGVLSLVLPAASYVNGAVLVIDGGMVAQNS